MKCLKNLVVAKRASKDRLLKLTHVRQTMLVSSARPLSSNGNRIAELSATSETLKDQLKTEKQRNLKLGQYTRKDNIRLLFVQEEDEENTEEVFIKCLTEMGVYNPDMKFHAVHRVGRPRGKQEEEAMTANQTTTLGTSFQDLSAVKTEI